ncbi:MAG: prephenate dehydrogenase/arogenate dehydrogenase family protein [Herpetosiphonaceae bacterium]|nr:prephenate dehydrogenase/arogenate dehydrogenase family protein [Herpetosiphonaceae bacterium]
MTRTIAILGTGLIGASLGLALGTADPETTPLGKSRIIGYDADRHQLRVARGRLALDVEARSAAEAVKEADIVIIATPVQTVPDMMREIAPHLRYRALVTDVCSTKSAVLRWARELLPTSVSFVGGHPMAGRESAGADHAELDLFRGSIYCLCPPISAQPEAVDLATALVETIGAKPYFIDPDEHDAYVAGVSHLPFLLSTALTEAAVRSPAWREMQLLAASGFRDISRLAGGDPTMHRDICLTNTASITHWINESIRVLVEIRSLIDTNDHDGLTEIFTHAKAARDTWLAQPGNQRPGEGEPLKREDLGSNTMSQLFFGNPGNLRKKKKE